MACRLFGDNPLSEPMMVYCQLDPAYFNEILCEIQKFSFMKMSAKMTAILSQP